MTNKIKGLQLKWKEEVQSPAHAQTIPKHMFQEYFIQPTPPQPYSSPTTTALLFQ